MRGGGHIGPGIHHVLSGFLRNDAGAVLYFVLD